MTELSVVIVNWNTYKLLRNCLNSVYQTIQGVSFETIVVDNGSADGSGRMVKKEFPQVNLIENPENRGFAKANNQALSIMTGRYALLLNTDTVLTPGAVRAMNDFLESNPTAAMACGQLLNEDGSKQNSIAPFPSIWTLVFNQPFLEYAFPNKFPSKRYTHSEPMEIDSGIGACLMVRKEAIDEVGMLDERYFFFMEETDWARQMKEKGWKIFFIPEAKIYHLQGQSVGNNIKSRIEFYRSRYKYFKKWNGGTTYKFLAAVVFIRLCVNWLLTSLANLLTLGLSEGLGRKSDIYFNLLLWHFKECPFRLK